MSYRKEVKSLQTDYQILLIETLSMVIKSKSKGDLYGYEENLHSLYASLPPETQLEFKKLLGADFKDYIRRLVYECRSQFDSFTNPIIVELECRPVRKHALDKMYEIIMKLMHKYGLLIIHRYVETGRER